jgi:hypothetical protein
MLLRVSWVVRIEGVVVTERDAWWLVDRLRARGRADDTTTAFAIEVAIESGEDVDQLTTRQKNSIREALGQHPVTLIALRTQLARDSF